MTSELAALYRRDLTRLLQELHAFPDQESLWQRLPGVSNAAGNLALHLEGNLREYIGRQLGGIPYTRRREEEFGRTGLAAEDLIARISDVQELVPRIVSRLSLAELEEPFPEIVLGVPASTRQVLLSVYGHLSYHLGQIDYLRRILTKGAAVKFVRL